MCGCSSILSFVILSSTFQIEGVIGITVDEESVVLVHVNEAFSTKKVRYRCALKARLHQVSASTLWQLSDDASDTALTENNGVFRMGLQPTCQVTLLFTMRTVSLVSSQNCHSVDADAWCRRALTSVCLGCIYMRVKAKAMPLPICCIVSNLCERQKIKEKIAFAFQFALI